MRIILYLGPVIGFAFAATVAGCLPSNDFNSTSICELQSENVDGSDEAELGFVPSDVIESLLLEGTSSLGWEDGEVTDLSWNIDGDDGEYFLVIEVDSVSGETSSACNDQYIEIRLAGQFSTADGGLDDSWPIALLVRDVDDVEVAGEYALEDLEGDLPDEIDGDSDNDIIRLQGTLTEAEFKGMLFLDSQYSDESSVTDGAWIKLGEWPSD
jgi:hypothetical protein